MPFENATTIEEFDPSWPDPTDPKSQGDDHIRSIKNTLKLIFPGAGGQGFNIPITATEEEINHLSGLTGNIQDQINDLVAADDLIAPSGTIMLFYMATPPVGWTQLANNDNSMLVVRDTAGAAGNLSGDDPVDWTHNHPTGDHTLTISEMPSHSHPVGKRGDATTSGGGERHVDSGSGGTTNSVGGGSAHNHGLTDDVSFTPRFIAVMTATKD